MEVLGLSSLRTLDLSQNSMTDIPTDFLSAPDSLAELKLTGNPLSVPKLADKGLSGVKSYLKVNGSRTSGFDRIGRSLVENCKKTWNHFFNSKFH